MVPVEIQALNAPYIQRCHEYGNLVQSFGGRRTGVSMDADQLIERAREQLARGFYVDNLLEVARVLRDMTLSTRWPTASFVLQRVTTAIANNWDDRAVSVDEANQVEQQLQPLLYQVLNLMAENAEAERLQDGLDQLVVAFESLRTTLLRP